MQTHTLKRVHKNKTSQQVGRGGTRGKTSGRGTKGQNARSGRKKRPELRDIIKKLPKLRGRGKNSNVGIQTKPIALNIGAISKAFSANDTVTTKTLLERGLITSYKGRVPQVKILSNGEVDKVLIISGCTISKVALAKLEKAGGQVK